MSNSAMSPPTPPLNLLTLTAVEIRRHFDQGVLTSRQLTEAYLAQIARHNGYLRAVVQTAPGALARADELDRERERVRAQGGDALGPLHGIPILIKDSIATDPSWGMETTQGCKALLGSKVPGNSAVAQRLHDAGMIVLGTTNSTVLGGARSGKIHPGWSEILGQTQSAYTTDEVDYSVPISSHSSPGGSATGSGVAVSAGFAPIAIGTDTCGSTVTPAGRAALYGMRVTVGLVPMTGIIGYSPDFDTIGPMAKSPEDLVALLDVMAGRGQVASGKAERASDSYAAYVKDDFAWLKVGALAPDFDYFEPSRQKYVKEAVEQVHELMTGAYAKVQKTAKTFKNVEMANSETIRLDGTSAFFGAMPRYHISLTGDVEARWSQNFEAYLATLTDCRIQTVSDLIRYNEENPVEGAPDGFDDQSSYHMYESLRESVDDARRAQLLKHTLHAARDLCLDKVFNEQDVDVILGPNDSYLTAIFSAAGYPAASVPIGQLTRHNGRPLGMNVVARAGREDLLVEFIAAWEVQKGFERAVPDLSRL